MTLPALGVVSRPTWTDLCGCRWQSMSGGTHPILVECHRHRWHGGAYVRRETGPVWTETCGCVCFEEPGQRFVCLIWVECAQHNAGGPTGPAMPSWSARPIFWRKP